MERKPTRDEIREMLRERWPSLPWGRGPLPPKVGDVIEVHAPRIGTWRVDAVVDDPSGWRYLKLSRRTGGSTEFRYIAPIGYEILSPQIEAE